jgi:TetR/AcrR family transcriptional regulator, regulator of autoinduction and epiphytic fitness
MTATEPVDGRRLRRDRNRETVVQALLSLYREGNLAPSADEIADRAGISARSLFRYFDDVDSLVRTAVARQQDHLAPLYAVSARPDQPLADRVDRFVADRVRLLEAMGPVGQLARALAPKQPLVAAELGRIRAVLRGQLVDVFGPELDRLGRGERAEVLAALDVACSWEAQHLLRQDQGVSRATASRVMARSIRRLLGGEA